MSRRTSPPFRADHVGSLLRPQRLLQARDDFAAGRITAADLRAVEDQEIPGAVRMQEEVGLQSATDGEFRRTTWHMDFIYALGGISKAPGNLAVKFVNPSGTIEWTPAALHVGSRVRLDGTIFGEDFAFLKSQVTTAVPKLLLHGGGQRADLRPAGRQAPPHRRGRPRHLGLAEHLGLSQACQFSRTASWSTRIALRTTSAETSASLRRSARACALSCA